MFDIISMSYGREHRYNLMFGGDIITPEPYNVKCRDEYDKLCKVNDHINCNKPCCVKQLHVVTCHRPCCRPCNQSVFNDNNQDCCKEKTKGPMRETCAKYESKCNCNYYDKSRCRAIFKPVCREKIEQIDVTVCDTRYKPICRKLKYK